MSFRYRDHRGGLAESMATLRTFHTKAELTQYLRDDLAGQFGFYCSEDEILVEPYDMGPDTRIGWDETWIVHIRGFGVLGMTDSEPK